QMSDSGTRDQSPTVPRSLAKLPAALGLLLTRPVYVMPHRWLLHRKSEFRVGSTRAIPVASQARQKYLSYLPESLQRQTRLCCVTPNSDGLSPVERRRFADIYSARIVESGTTAKEVVCRGS